MEQHGKLLPGQVYVSSSGCLPCKKVIHAVGPVWHDGWHNEYNNLYVAVYDSLATADKLGYTSIALPALSCGTYSFPEDRGTRGICRAVKDFLEDKKETSVRKVSLIDLRERVVEEFHRNLGAMFGFCLMERWNKNRHQSTGKSLCFSYVTCPPTEKSK